MFSSARKQWVLAVVAFGWLLFADRAPAGIVSYTDIDEFRAAAGNVIEIDFETLPDGFPTPFDRVNITPDYNYTPQGVTFSSPVPDLFVRDTGSGGRLQASHYLGSSGGITWINADFVIPVTAVGIVFPGGTTLSLFDEQNHLLSTLSGGGSGTGFFLGVVSETPIGSVVVNRNTSFQTLESFLFTPIPEPATVVLLTLGAVALMRRRPRNA